MIRDALSHRGRFTFEPTMFAAEVIEGKMSQYRLLVSDSMSITSSIMITGSRDVDRVQAQIIFEQHLSPYLSQGRTWLLGTALGIDHWAMEWLLENSENCWAVVPYTRFKQPRWVQPWLEQLDRIIELQLPQRKTASAIRNRYMVDLSQIVFGFWTGRGSGITKTLKYALRQRRETHAIPIVLSADQASGVPLQRLV